MVNVSNGQRQPVLDTAPQTLDVATGARVGAVVLTWDAGAADAVELRVDAPDGQLFHRGRAKGTAATGQWVRDGTVFYLQDGSRPDETLASVEIDLPVVWLSLDVKEVIGQIVGRLFRSDATQAILVPSHPRSLVCRVKTAGGTTYFKCYLAIESDLVALEAWAYETLAAIGVPVPNVLALDLRRTSFPAPYVVLTELTGHPLAAHVDASGKTTHELYRQVGAYLARVHGVEVGGFGALDAAAYQDTGRVRGLASSWEVFIEGRLASLIHRLELTRAPERPLIAQIQAAAHRLGSSAGPFAGSARLLHGDFDSSQVFVGPDCVSLSGLFDFDDVAAGDPAWDLATIGHRDGSDALEAVLVGYAPDAALRARLQRAKPLYDMLDSLMGIVSAFERGSTEHGTRELDRLRNGLEP